MGLIHRLSAQLPDEGRARAFAADFLRAKAGVLKRGGANLSLRHVAKGGYIFTPSDGEGFVWIAGKEEQPVVVGYSLEGQTQDAPLPSLLQEVMDVLPDGYVPRSSREVTEPIVPLLTSVWVQGEPFNGKCPRYRYDNGTVSANRCLVGCVATAVSEVLRYHAYPEVLLDTLHGWNTSHYDIADVLPGVRFDWDNMLDRYDNGYTAEEAEAVQNLSLYCGMACQMNYGLSASGSNTYKLMEPLERVFGYQYVTYYDRSMYSPGGWDGVLRYELRRGVPLVYSAFNFQFTGHAFVIDGMDDSGLYHTRWGESDGFYDGYFDIDVLGGYESKEQATETGSLVGLFCNQSALAIFPEQLEPYAGDTLTFRAEDITVDAVRFRRNPDTNGMVAADVTVTNHSCDTIRYTILGFVSDTETVTDWTQVDDVAFTAVTLLPEHTTEFSIYCDFKRSGLRYFGLTGDQEHMLYMEPLQVDEGGNYRLTVGQGEICHVSDHDVTLRLRLENESEDGWCGDLVTYSLYPKDGVYYRAHWNLLELAPGEILSDTVSFGFLTPGTNYILRVRCPWTVIYQYEFSTLSSDVVGEIPQTDDGRWCTVHTVQGIRMGRMRREDVEDFLKLQSKGLYIVVPDEGKPRKIYNP